MMESQVKVVVRVRPLTQRELGWNSNCVIRMEENRLFLKAAAASHENQATEREFRFDQCFWSRSDKDQEDAFSRIVRDVAAGASEGFNYCVFAYGQTGSGKTYSMVGTEDFPGLIPRICSALFQESDGSESRSSTVTVSYIEIHNEDVRDLLNPADRQKPLTVREHELLGPYVEGLSHHEVSSAENVMSLIKEGDRHRTSEQRDLKDSRSHVILTLTVLQSSINEQGSPQELQSTITLADLAGTGNTAMMEASGNHLQETTTMDKSVTTLGLIIHSLAGQSDPNPKIDSVNFRQSVLTWLLKNNLGGNSRTVMLATVIPTAEHYQETLSTLNCAESAKRIVNQAMVNSNLNAKVTKELQEEIETFREKLLQAEAEKVPEIRTRLEGSENLLKVIKDNWESQRKKMIDKSSGHKFEEESQEDMDWNDDNSNAPYITEMNCGAEALPAEGEKRLPEDGTETSTARQEMESEHLTRGSDKDNQRCDVNAEHNDLHPHHNDDINNDTRALSHYETWEGDQNIEMTDVSAEPKTEKNENSSYEAGPDIDVMLSHESSTLITAPQPSFQEKCDNDNDAKMTSDGKNADITSDDKDPIRITDKQNEEYQFPMEDTHPKQSSSQEEDVEPLSSTMRGSSKDPEIAVEKSIEEVAEILRRDFPSWLDSLRFGGIITKENHMNVKEIPEEDAQVESLLNIIKQKQAPAIEAFFEFTRKQQDKEGQFEELLEKMRFAGPKNCKLTLQDVLQISSEFMMDDFSAVDVLWFFIRQLISLKGEARNINKFYTNLKGSVNHKEEEEEDSFLFSSESDPQNGLHPLDVVCAAFHCSDHFLHQEMASKMAMCQFAIPLLLPAADSPQSTFMLWAMRDIVKKWRKQSLADKKEFQEDSLVNISMPVISFVRLGNCSISKSKILNQLLSSIQHRHEIFVHRDMEGGTAERTISEGLVEMSWYFPAGKGNFPEPVAFTNLRGGLESNLRQFQFLTEVSSVVVVLMSRISEDQCQRILEFNSSDTKYLFVINPEENNTKRETDERLKLLAPVLNLTRENVLVIPKSTNEATTTSKIYQSLLPLIQHKSITLKEMAKHASHLGFCIDEDSKDFQTSKLNAKKMSAYIEVGKYKNETMKLQADPLRRLAKLEKEICQMKLQGNENGEKYKSDLRRQCDSIRENQWKSEIPKGILQFINALQSPNMAEKMYFLKWIRFNLDSVARKCLSPLQAEYKEKCSSSYSHKELSELDQKISDSSLGIEHFLREVGQLYEAWHFMGERSKSPDVPFESLPEMAADLLLNGFPLELLDGDASRIPLQWIKDVWSQVDKKTQGRSRLRVITVLGVQSTGKSTLLNTMFGLQFPVASGRCTRGAFMTLLKVTESYQEELRCQFLLVIDTEGLKAPELDSLDGSYEHDNELATLVIGLSDITIINMAMENTSEMKDILQIVIHAFLRMKEIGKKPICHFVHQNVSDVSAPVMNMRGRKKMVDQFDEMTRTVAEMEKRPQFKSFSDVMEYDLDHHNWYIPGLWHGVPPMASVSSAYSEQVHEMKKKLLNSMKGNQSGTHTIPEFITWMTDLWSAVKHENFIFSFRNSFIAKAYNQLSAKYSELEWKFNKSMHEWLTKSETLIKNQPAETLEAKVNECRREADHILTKGERSMLSWLDKYFKQETECSQLIKYQGEFVISAKSLRKNLETSSINKLNDAIQLQRDQIKLQNVYRDHIERIEQKVSDLIDDCRREKIELDDQELEEKLENIWKETAKELVLPPLPERDIEGEMLIILSKDMKEKGSGVNEKIQKIKKIPMPKEQQNSGYGAMIVNTYKYFGRKYRNWRGKFREEDFVQSVLHQCIYYAEEQACKNVNYDDTYCKGILKIIDEKLEKGEVKNHFPADRELDLKLKVLGHVLGMFQTMHRNFLIQNDPRIKLDSLKPVYFDTFKASFQKKNESQSLAKRICENILKPSLTDYIYIRLGIEVADDILQSKGSEKYASRMFFQFAVLKSLLEENDVKHFVEYSNDYETFVKSWILKYILDEYKNINVLQNKILSEIMGRIKTILITSEDLNFEDVSAFLARMSEELTSFLVLPQEKIKAILFKNSASVGDFIKYMSNSLKDTEEDIKSMLELQPIECALSKVTLKPEYILFKKVFGCGKQCPFCKTPCEAGGRDHKEHFASVHRPQGLGHYRWVTTEVLCHDICSTCVEGKTMFRNRDTKGNPHPYKDYRDYYPDWKIQPDSSIEASDYWKFVLKEFNKQFAEEYSARPANYPAEWNALTREKAMECLQKLYNI